MSRRVSLPRAEELFRPTTGEPTDTPSGPRPVAAVPDQRPDTDPSAGAAAARPSSGRVRHDEKVTIYLTAEEFLELEQARLALRAEHAVAVDRGRLVREAIAIALADLAGNGADAVLVSRLTDR